MSGQSNDIAALFGKRMQVIGKLSHENAEHLRMLQMRSGHQVLSMKDPDAVEINVRKQDTESQLETCLQRIETLERELVLLDEQIAAAARKEDQNG